jgi:fermentation-respiration switch protein FrsA (DUF1100 family)
MVTLATPCEMPWSEGLEFLVEEDEYIKLPSGRRLKKCFFEDLRRYDILRLVKEAPPILIIHGSSDELVPLEQAYKLYEAASVPKRIEIVEGADHSFSRGLDRALTAIIDWFKKFLS